MVFGRSTERERGCCCDNVTPPPIRYATLLLHQQHYPGPSRTHQQVHEQVGGPGHLLPHFVAQASISSTCSIQCALIVAGYLVMIMNSDY